MGPYCRFCNARCFVPIPLLTPEHIRTAYGKLTIVATCLAGQRFEKERLGHCYDEIVLAIDNPPTEANQP